MTDEPEPDIFTRYGADLLGPWADLPPTARAAWLDLAQQVEQQRNEESDA